MWKYLSLYLTLDVVRTLEGTADNMWGAKVQTKDERRDGG